MKTSQRCVEVHYPQEEQTLTDGNDRLWGVKLRQYAGLDYSNHYSPSPPGDTSIGHPGESDLPYTGCAANGALQIGLCVSGQKAAQLLRRLRSVLLDSMPLLDNILLMIGVNDFLQGNRLGILKMRLLKIVKLLSSHNKNVVVLTVPPIPKLSMEYNVQLLKYNKFVIKMGST
uniref:(California timema) hypothetical protein n=1 Tax=Timema californicum TaxID=61474 RepID=A0A7R9PE22_TIMCA|nr:unnamed protein product [Timema californicum]